MILDHWKVKHDFNSRNLNYLNEVPFYQQKLGVFSKKETFEPYLDRIEKT